MERAGIAAELQRCAGGDAAALQHKEITGTLQQPNSCELNFCCTRGQIHGTISMPLSRHSQT